MDLSSTICSLDFLKNFNEDFKKYIECKQIEPEITKFRQLYVQKSENVKRQIKSQKYTTVNDRDMELIKKYSKDFSDDIKYSDFIDYIMNFEGAYGYVDINILDKY